MSKSLVVKEPKRGPARSLSVLAAGAVAVGGFLWLTPADPDEQAVTPTAQPAALASPAHSSNAGVEVVSHCEPNENGPVEVDYERLDTLAIDRTPIDHALAALIR